MRTTGSSKIDYQSPKITSASHALKQAIETSLSAQLATVGTFARLTAAVLLFFDSYGDIEGKDVIMADLEEMVKDLKNQVNNVSSAFLLKQKWALISFCASDFYPLSPALLSRLVFSLSLSLFLSPLTIVSYY